MTNITEKLRKLNFFKVEGLSFDPQKFVLFFLKKVNSYLFSRHDFKRLISIFVIDPHVHNKIGIDLISLNMAIN